MKKLITIVAALVLGLPAWSQNINPAGDYMHRDITVEEDQNDTAMKAPKACCNMCHCMPHWYVDINLTGGGLMQQYTAIDPTAAYPNVVSAKSASLSFNNGMSYGIDAELGYFFGRKRHFGIGAGLMYMYQTGNLTMDQFHVEYQSADGMGNTFRQLLTSDGKVKEDLAISNFNIPLLFKYKTQFSRRVGFTVDAGLLFNLNVTDYYDAKTAFDYEAIYKYTNVGGTTIPVFDNAQVPGSSDLLITKSQYEADGYKNVAQYFQTLQSHGYNVGLGVNPYKNTGHVAYNVGSVGLLLRPAVSIALCSRASLNLGVYYIYQDQSRTAAAGYRLTDKVGQYSSLLNTVSGSINNSFGLNVGVRFSLCCKHAPKAVGAAGDVNQPEPPKDTIEPVQEEAPVASPTTVEEQPEPEEKADVSSPILFDFNKTSIHESSYPVLEEAAQELKDDPTSTVTVHGYTDSRGTAAYNKILSKRRANAVKSYLRKKGVNPRSIKTVGHGLKHPAASNKTAEGRAKNRRAVMKMNEGKH